MPPSYLRIPWPYYFITDHANRLGVELAKPSIVAGLVFGYVVLRRDPLAIHHFAMKRGICLLLQTLPSSSHYHDDHIGFGSIRPLGLRFSNHTKIKCVDCVRCGPYACEGV